MSCPLCHSELRQNLLSPSVAVLVCVGEKCVYPFNLSREDMVKNQLLVRTNEQTVMSQMRSKLDDAGVEQQMCNFLSKPDPEVMGGAE